MEHHVGITNLDDDKFVIKKSTRLIDLFEKMDIIGAVVRRENYRNGRDFLQLMNIIVKILF